MASSFLVLILLFAVLGQSHYIAKRFDNSTAINSTCTPEKRAANVRKEWSNLTLTERTEYIDAVLCLQSLPSILDDVPGAITRFDDFAATHINLTLQIHLDGRFLSWHRQFVYLYETALRDECGFNGSQPYWNWPMWAGNLSGSPLFDGSATSLSGDGAKVDDPQHYSVGNNETLPHSTRGGCVLSGPFVNHTMNLGPFDFSLAFENIFPANWSVYNPHCFICDLNDEVALRYGNQTALDNLLASSTIIDFQNNLNGLNLDLGVHGGGHFSIGIGLQDFFASPLDPAFYLHHGGVDRMWTLWQAMDPDNRQYAINGTGTIFNQDTTPEVTVDTVQGWGFLGEEKLTGELMSVEAFDYCYEYL